MITQISDIIERYRGEPGPLIVVLHAIQSKFGYIPEEAKAMVADGLNLSRAEVHGVVTFYHFFRHHPPGRHVVQICQAESCQSMGADRSRPTRSRSSASISTRPRPTVASRSSRSTASATAPARPP